MVLTFGFFARIPLPTSLRSATFPPGEGFFDKLNSLS